MMSERIQNELRSVAEYWNVVEARIKEAELIRHTVVAASIKELRYAGRWLVNTIVYALDNRDSLSDPEDPEIARELERRLFEVKLNIIQASHDAIDASLDAIWEAFERVEREAGKAALLEYFPQYTDGIARLTRIGSFIALSRQDRARQNDIYENFYKEDFPFLKGLLEQINTSDQLLAAAIEREEENKKLVEAREEIAQKRVDRGFAWTIAGGWMTAVGFILSLPPAVKEWWPLLKIWLGI